MEKRLVHLLMIALVITCPVRCMVEGCCINTPTAVTGIEIGCCCSLPLTDSESSDVPDLPCGKCQCSCFCAGATIPDTFEVDPTLQWQYLFTLDQQFNAYDALAVKPANDACWDYDPPDFLIGNDSGNTGRAIRFKNSSLLN